MSLRQRVLARLQRAFAQERLPLRLVFWDGEAFDFAEAPTVTITLRSPSLLRMLLTGRMARLGDAYVRGDLLVDGPVEDILTTGIRLAKRIGKASRLGKVAPLLRRHPRRRSRRRDAADIRHHYDVSNEFYALWLDRSMTYSCAYFRNGDEDIDTAQTQKLDHICRKLRLEPDQRLLDIGCGWGGLLRHACAGYGVRGLGITNSAQQHRYADERAAGDSRMEFRLQDYRDLAGETPFDRILSVGMYEHVGLQQLPNYFALVARLLKPGGVLLNHGIVVTDPNGPQGPPGGEFIGRHVFPGGELPHLSRVLREAALNGLEVVDVEDLRPHYARTLMLWVHRLEAHRDEAIALAGADRYRVWRIYLAGMALAFDAGWLSVAQVLAYKPRNGRPAVRPWSRAYQYAEGAPVPFATGLPWTRTAH
jgi:cyclopropane-fatty-acyl-phospholipid synthase